MSISSAAVVKLEAAIRGQVVLPEHSQFDATREIWNRLHDRRPALVVRCTGPADVAAAIRFAREQNLEIAVRGGGHHAAGYASCDGGLLLDLSPMRGIHVDPVRQTALAQGGCTWAGFDHETQEFGLACTGPIVSMTGLPGFLLGGGFGWLQRKLGLGCDHLVGADVVDAEGRHVHTSAADDPELLWGLRGAGWNFGIVTSMELRLDRVGPEVLAGLVYFPIERFAELCQFHRSALDDAPAELTTWLILRLAPKVAGIPESFQGRPVCAIAFCHCGEKTDAETWANRIRQGVGDPFGDSIDWRRYSDWQRALDGRWGNGFYNDWRSFYFDELSTPCMEVIRKYVLRIDSPYTDIKIPHMGGAVAQEPEGGTSFANRRRRYCLVIQARWSDANESPKHLQWSKDLQSELQPYNAEGAYPNFLAPDESARIRSAYGDEGYRRLAALKTRMDPGNVFHLNPNIAPAGKA